MFISDRPAFMAKFFYLWQHDSIFFIGTMAKDLNLFISEVFRTDCPSFMPVKYVDKMEQRLDNNILFYENIGQER